MNNLSLKFKRIIAYIIQVIFIIIVYTSLFIFLNLAFIKTMQLILSIILLRIQESVTSLVSSIDISNSDIINFIKGLNISPSDFTNFIQNGNIADLSNQLQTEAIKHILNSPIVNTISIIFIFLLIIYSIIFFTLLPLITKGILYLTGDIGKKLMGLSVIRNNKKLKNSTSIKTSPAYNTFKLYYRLVLFFLITRPLYLILFDLDFPNFFSIIIKLFYVLSILQVIISIIKILIYLINFILGNDNWRKKAHIEVIDNRIQTAVVPNPTTIRFPELYKFMMGLNYSNDEYYSLEQKAKEVPKLSDLLNHIEVNQELDPNYIQNNFSQFKKIISLIE